MKRVLLLLMLAGCASADKPEPPFQPPEGGRAQFRLGDGQVIYCELRRAHGCVDFVNCADGRVHLCVSDARTVLNEP